MEYQANRTLANGIYDIDNPNIVDTEGNIIPLARVIADAFLSKGIIYVSCDGEAITIKNKNNWDAGEMALVDQIVTNYKQGIVS